MRYTIDRIDEGIATLLSLTHAEARTIEQATLPPGAMEGDVLEETAAGGWIALPEETTQRRTHAQELLDHLLQKNANAGI